MKKYSMLEWTSEKVSRFWDYESQFPQNYFTNLFGDVIIDRLNHYLQGHTHILDYGCGMGFMTKHLLDKGYSVTGLDFSRDSVLAVNHRLKGINGFNGAFFVDEVLAQRNKFDAILVFEVIEHLTDEYLDATLNNIKALLAPGGVIVFTTPNREKLEDLHIFCPECAQVFHRWQHVRTWDASSLSSFLSEREFQILNVFATNFSISFHKKFREALKYHLRKILRLPLSNPHLACICTLRSIEVG